MSLYCPRCTRFLVYVQQVYERHDINGLDAHADVSFEGLNETHRDEAVDPHLECSSCDWQSTLDDAVKRPLSRCENCGTTAPTAFLPPLKDPAQRVAPGEPMPSGACGACGAVCHPLEEEHGS